MKKTVLTFLLLLLPALIFAARQWNFSLGLGFFDDSYGVQKIAEQDKKKYDADSSWYGSSVSSVIEMSFDARLFGSDIWFLRASTHACMYQVLETQYYPSMWPILDIFETNGLIYAGLGPEIVLNLTSSLELRLCGEIGYNFDFPDPTTPADVYKGFGGITLSFDAGLAYFFTENFNMGLRAGITNGGFLYMLTIGCAG